MLWQRTDDRAIPIHERIVPFIADWLADGGEYLYTPCKDDDHAPRHLINVLTYRWHISPVLKSLPRRHLPHDGRHTCATMLDNARVNLRTAQLILGHASESITRSVYTHKTIAQLVEAINRI